MKLEKLNKRKSVQGSILFFSILCYILTWIYIVPNALYSHKLILIPMPSVLNYIAAFGPAISAVITTFVFYDKKAVFQLLKNIVIWRVHIKWYMIALFIQPIITLAAIGIYILLGGNAPNFGDAVVFQIMKGINSSNAALIFVPYLLLQMLSVLGEEVGWRGYALPKLLSTKKWIASSIILGLLWALWHLPLFLTVGSVQSGISPLWYNVDLIASSFLFTWLYINTKGSILIATLFHASINSFTIFLPVVPMLNGDMKPYIISTMLKWVLIVFIANKKRLSIISEDLLKSTNAE